MTIDLTKYKTVISTIERGETVRINHDPCPSGVDTKRRLYITRVQADPRKVIAYCHNCQDDGGLLTKEYERFRNRHAYKTSSPSTPDCKEIIGAPTNIIYT